MCLISQAKKKSLINPKHLEAGQERNKDGWGIMYPDGKRVCVARGMGDAKEFNAALALVPDNTPVAVHFRMATAGPTDLANCHPFKVLSFEEHGQDLFLMHNGPKIMPGFNGDKKRSDTLQFVEELLVPLLKGNPRLIRSKALHKMIAAAVNRDRLVFLEGCGKWHCINENEGKWEKGAWYSNTYSLWHEPVVSAYSPKGDFYGVDSATHDHTKAQVWKRNNTYGPPSPEDIQNGYWDMNAAKWIKATRAWNPVDAGFVDRGDGVYVKAPAPTLKVIASTGTAIIGNLPHVQRLLADGTADRAADHALQRELYGTSAKRVVRASRDATVASSRLLAECPEDGKACILGCKLGGICRVSEASPDNDTEQRMIAEINPCPGTGRPCAKACPDGVCDHVFPEATIAGTLSKLEQEAAAIVERKAQERKSAWEQRNLIMMQDNDIFQLVTEDPEGATDFIVDVLFGRTGKAYAGGHG